MNERIEVYVTLVAPQAAEDSEVRITFDVTASALVREYGHAVGEPGEMLVEDIEINSVRLMSISFGAFGAMWPGDTLCTSMVAIENQRRLDWLNSQLDDRDEWRDRIAAAVVARHDTARAVY